MNLQNWIDMADRHWKEFQPKRYAALKAAGKLQEALREAASQTYSEVSQLEDSGFNPEEAWQMTREKYLLPTEEKDADGVAPENKPQTHDMRDLVKAGQRTMPA